MRKRMLKQTIAVTSIVLVGLGLAVWTLFLSSAQANSTIATPSVSESFAPVLDTTADIPHVKTSPAVAYQTPSAGQTLTQHNLDIQDPQGRTILPKTPIGDLSGEVTEIQAPLLTLSKTGPSLAKLNDVIVYTIVVTNTGDPAQNVVLSDVLPYTGVFIPGSCTYYQQGSTAQPCGPLNQLWQEDLATGDRITTTFSVQVTAGSMNWPMVNCAYLNWNGQQTSSCWTTTVVNVPIFTLSKTGPEFARTNDVIVYTIVVTNTGDPAQNVVLSDVLPYTGVFIPGSCTYYRQGGTPQPCGPLNQLWQEYIATGERITTTFSVRVTAGSMDWPMVNCAYLSWDTVQMSSCWTTVVNHMEKAYLPLVLRNYPPSTCYPYLITEVNAGAWAYGVDLDTAGRRAFIASDSGITVIHADTYALITWIPLPSAFGVAYDPDHDRIWVTRINADRVAVLDGTTYAQVADLPAGGQPRYAVYNPTNNRVYVTTKYQGGTVNVYNAVSPGYERTLTNVADPGQIAVNPVTNRIYVANHVPNGQLTVIRGDTHQTYRIASGVFDAFGVTVDTTRNLIYVASVYEGRLSVIDGATEQGLGTMNLQRSDGRTVPIVVLAFNPDLGPEGHLWLVTSSVEPDGEDQVLLIPNGWPTLGTPVPVDLSNYPKWGIAIDPVTDRVWVPIVTDALASVVQDGEPVCTVPFRLSDTGTKEGGEFIIQVSTAPR